jgi:hypothetical protein
MRVFRHHPTIREVALDIHPVEIGGVRQVFRGGLIEPESSYRIPEFLFDLLPGELIDAMDTGVVAKLFDEKALSLIVADVCRAAVKVD